ncbi:MAG: hypothetical protein LIP23_04335, partial [Planctomycetes bacterium]|nr:hypothetical protein [Planctomycetota bacterium]
MRHGLFSTGRNGMRLAALSGLAMLALLAWGCSEPVTTYQVAGSKLGGGERVLVLPFQDTRTLVEDNDPHKEDLGTHARDIFISAMKEFPNAESVTIITPDERPSAGSLTIAQLAEAGRKHQADVVIAGQVFSYTGTRAASIPPRAGMFIRAVSVKDGSLLFVGDDYVSAAIPGASGGRELQAKNVSKRLLESLVEQVKPVAVALIPRAASSAAYAMLAPGRAIFANQEGNGGDKSGFDTVPAPEPPPFIDMDIAPPLSQIDWDKQIAPEAPPLFDISDDFYSLPPPKPVAIDQPLPAERNEKPAVASVTESTASQDEA